MPTDNAFAVLKRYGYEPKTIKEVDTARAEMKNKKLPSADRDRARREESPKNKFTFLFGAMKRRSGIEPEQFARLWDGCPPAPPTKLKRVAE